ncbi:MAG: WG repeat-containing protein [Azoarcus sp.]|jgi:hypothetical protein|nr:WG repeat-containing protein [Azoarcus sp.]
MQSARVRLFTWIALGALCLCAAWARADPDPARREAVGRAIEEVRPAVTGCEQAAKRAEEDEARQRAEFEWVIEPRFDRVWDFAADGLARVRVNGKGQGSHRAAF